MRIAGGVVLHRDFLRISFALTVLMLSWQNDGRLASQSRTPMKLPNADLAEITESKLRDYLLSKDHPVGRFKAAFFARLGYSQESWRRLETDIRRLLSGDAEEVGSSEYGRKFLVRGTLNGPAGRANVITAWILLNGEQRPRLITAYPED